MISSEGLRLIEQFEGCKLEAYLCPAGKWTIGYGHTGKVKEGSRMVAIKKGMKIKEEVAEELLLEDLSKFEKAVRIATKGCELTENQIAALTSWAFNIGVTAFENSTALRKIKEKAHINEVAKGIMMFTLISQGQGKTESKGLMNRRIEEAKLFLKG